METAELSTFIKQIEELTQKPEKYLSLQENQVEPIKNFTRKLYNYSRQKDNVKTKSADVVPQLIVKNLDEEQIWQQIELQNNSVCDSLVSNIAHLLSKKNILKFPVKEKKKEPIQERNSKKVCFSNNENNYLKNNDDKSASFKKNKGLNNNKKKKSIVDDKFFKLSEMEEFLEKIEKGEENLDGEDSEVDYFEDDDSSENFENQPRYNDFFDKPEDENLPDVDTDQNSYSKKATLEDEKTENERDELEDRASHSDSEDKDFEEDELNNSDEDDNNDFGNEDDNYDYNDDGDDDGDNDDDDVDDNDNDNYDIKGKSINATDSENKVSEQPSTFEDRQKRLKLRIENLENEALKEKPWQLIGEVTGNNRPQNSLLEEYVEFDIATRPAPVLTEKSTLKLEDVILQRIKDKAWDDVVRKFKPVDVDTEYRKKLVLDQEKSKLSLAQIYEQEYLKHLENKTDNSVDKLEVEPPEHQEIKILMKKLFVNLDALSNFHFTPKLVEPEVKIVNNLPAITMEEVAPVAASEATLLAPEEVKLKQKGSLIGKSERTSTDKKRERRSKKLKQKLKQKQLEAKRNLKADKPDAKNQEKLSSNLLQKITNGKVIQLDNNKNEKYIRSSSTFFSKLQNESSNPSKKKALESNKIKAGKKVKKRD